MRQWVTICLIAGCMVFAGCVSAESADTPDTSATDSETTPTAEMTAEPTLDQTTDVGFMATISGAEQTEISGLGNLSCEAANQERLVIGPNQETANTIIITVPHDVTETTYTLQADTSDDADVTAAYIGGAEANTYDRDVSGTVTITQLPQAEDENVGGTFDFDAFNIDGEQVNVQGTFDFKTGLNAFEACQPLTEATETPDNSAD